MPLLSGAASLAAQGGSCAYAQYNDMSNSLDICNSLIYVPWSYKYEAKNADSPIIPSCCRNLSPSAMQVKVCKVEGPMSANAKDAICHYQHVSKPKTMHQKGEIYKRIRAYEYWQSGTQDVQRELVEEEVP